MNNRKVIIALGMMLIGGCGIPHHLPLMADHPVSASFKGKADTTATTVTFDRFFTDRKLVALIDTALHNNADLLIASERIELARANMRLHKRALYPSVDLAVTAGGRQYGKYTIDGVGNAAAPEIPQPFTPDYLAGIASRWEVDLWGKLRKKKEAARLRFLAAGAGRDLVANGLVAEVAYRYYTLAALDEELIIIRKNIGLQEHALEIIRLQKEGGRATELAVKQFTAQLATTRAMEYRVLMDMTGTENEINFLLGRYARPVDRTSAISDEVVGMAGIGVPSSLLQRRPDIVQAGLELNASEAEVASARAAFLPSFNISAMGGYNAYNTSMLFNPGSLVYGVAGGLATPLLNRNQVRANYDMALAEHKAAWLQYGKTVMNAVFEVCTCLEQIDQLQSQHRLNQDAAAALNEAIAISNDIYLAGYANYLEVITAQKNALEAQLEVVQIRKKILFAKVNLYRALGGR